MPQAPEIDLAALAAAAGLRARPELQGPLLAQIRRLDALSAQGSSEPQAELPPQTESVPLRGDVRMPSPAKTVLRGLGSVGVLVELPGVPHAATARAPAREMRMTHIERVSDGESLSLPSWPPTREDAK